MNETITNWNATTNLLTKNPASVVNLNDLCHNYLQNNGSLGFNINAALFLSTISTFAFFYLTVRFFITIINSEHNWPKEKRIILAVAWIAGFVAYILLLVVAIKAYVVGA
jgi:predicted neutral ceramidase superfamily lipid hydrolase